MLTAMKIQERELCVCVPARACEWEREREREGDLFYLIVLVIVDDTITIFMCLIYETLFVGQMFKNINTEWAMKK